MMMSHPGVVLNTIGVVATFSPPVPAAKLVGLLVCWVGFFRGAVQMLWFCWKELFFGGGEGRELCLLLVLICFFQNEWKRELVWMFFSLFEWRDTVFTKNLEAKLIDFRNSLTKTEYDKIRCQILRQDFVFFLTSRWFVRWVGFNPLPGMPVANEALAWDPRA